MKATKCLMAATLLAFAPAAALAQDYNNSMGTTYAAPQQEEDDDFPWGLLGLLGLAGLLGMKKREPDIHVDARRDNTRP